MEHTNNGAVSRSEALRIIGLSFVVAFTGAAAPGPMLALVIGQTLAGGAWSVIFILAGHAAVELVFVLLLASGLRRTLRGPLVRGTLSVLGGVMLGWMGVGMLHAVSDASLAAASPGQRLAWYLLIFAGAGVSLSNPYFTGWWGTVGSGQLAAMKISSPGRYAAFLLGHELGDAVWFGAVAVVFAVGRAWLSDRMYQVVLLVCALAICVLAVMFTIMGIGWLLQGIRCRRSWTLDAADG